jgi:uncharacterized protein YhbP (UPF0306 family)
MTDDPKGTNAAPSWATVPKLLEENLYLVLGTADADGHPWATPVFFGADGESMVYWVSSPDSRHSRNIAARPDIAITVFNSTVPVGAAEAIYLEATAQTAAPAVRENGLNCLNARLPAGKELVADDLEPAGPLRLYAAVISKYHVLIRGGDARFDNVTDARIEVTPA